MALHEMAWHHMGALADTFRRLFVPPEYAPGTYVIQGTCIGDGGDFGVGPSGHEILVEVHHANLGPIQYMCPEHGVHIQLQRVSPLTDSSGVR